MRCFISTIRFLAAALAAGLICVATSHAGHKPGHNQGGGGDTAAFILVDLTGLPAGSSLQSDAHAVSQADGAGQVLVAGNSYTQGEFRVTGWMVAGDGAMTGPVDLGGPDVDPGLLLDLNDSGIVVAGDHVIVPGDGACALPTMGGVEAAGHAINNLNEIVGSIVFDDGVTRQSFGALWVLDPDGIPGDPISLGGFLPYDVNDLGDMAGEWLGQPAIASIDAGGNLHVDQLGPLPGHTSGQANAISSDGTWVAGESRGADDTEAFLWSAGTGMVGLGRFGGVTSIANAVNNAGQVVGWTDTGGGKHSQTAFLWQNGTMFDLNSLTDTGGKIHLAQARDINDDSHVVGLMGISRPTSESHGFLLIPSDLSR